MKSVSRNIKLSASQKAKVAAAISHHEKLKGAYFWTAPANASGRRAMEKRESKRIGFTLNATRYEYHCDVTCSCNNVYVTSEFMVDGEKKTVRAFKQLLTPGQHVKRFAPVVVTSAEIAF